MKNTTLLALVQNSNFKPEKEGKLPTINYVYPDYTANGLSEDFRFSETLRCELFGRAHIVRDALADKEVAYSSDDALMLELHTIVPRLDLDVHVNGNGSAIYPYAPLLFVGVSADNSMFCIFVVKPLVDASMAWFELTPAEALSIKRLLLRKARLQPFRPWRKRLCSKKPAMPVKSNDFVCRESVMEALRAGGEIYYAPATAGALALHLKGQRVPDAQPTLDEFLSLQAANQIDVVESVRQGHTVFRGLVDTYQLV